MTDLGGLADKARDYAEQNPDKVDSGLDRAGEEAKERLGHDEQVDAAVDKAQDRIPGTSEPQ